MKENKLFKIKSSVYLVAGVDTKALTIGGVKGEPFMKDDQPDTCPGMFRGIWLQRPFTYPGHIYADVSNTFLAMQASTMRCLRLPPADDQKRVRQTTFNHEQERKCKKNTAIVHRMIRNTLHCALKTSHQKKKL